MSPAEKLAKKLKRENNGHVPAQGRPIVWPNCELINKRKALHLTLADVSEQVGVSASTLNNIEKGTDPQLSTALKIAAFFGCTVEEIWPTEE